MIYHSYSSAVIVLLVILTSSAKQSLGAATFIDLPTGDVVANIEGAINATTLTCNVINDEGVQLTTTWSVANFKGELGIRPLSIVDTLHIWWRSNPQHNLHVFEPNNYCKLDVCFGWCDTVLWHWWRSRSSKCFLEDLSTSRIER